jgi:cytochrome c-type biogenesis protein
MRKIELTMGGLLVVVGVMMATGVFTAFAFWLLQTFPSLGTIG